MNFRKRGEGGSISIQINLLPNFGIPEKKAQHRTRAGHNVLRSSNVIEVGQIFFCHQLNLQMIVMVLVMMVD